MNEKQFVIDKKLNKNNAKEKGYEWVIDMVYDPEKINQMVIEDFLGVYKNGYAYSPLGLIGSVPWDSNLVGTIASYSYDFSNPLIIDAADYEMLNKFKWYAKKPSADKSIFYVARSVREGKKVRTVYMHRFIMNCPIDKEVDHKNGNRLNNSRVNLEVVTKQENIRRTLEGIKDDQSNQM